jgi:ABC-type transport system involved in multi-copper enzyme maturation permease subunit
VSDRTTAPAVGTIHDLGYKRYGGTRQAAGTRWRVIMRNQIATGWKSWWRFKASLGFAVITMFIAGGIMFLLKDRTVRGMGMIGGFAATMADAALPKSIEWFIRAAFLVTLTVGSRVVAGDLQTGAFTFYFARSVRARDYVIGKLAGMCVLIGIIMIGGPLVLAIARLGLSESTDQLIDALPLIPKALAVGVLGTLAFAAVPLGFSALVPNVRYAMALWAAYYLVFGLMVSLLASASTGWLGALDLATALESVTFELFHLELFRGRAAHVPPDVALASLLLHAGAAIALVSYQVRRAHGSGVGGAS